MRDTDSLRTTLLRPGILRTGFSTETEQVTKHFPQPHCSAASYMSQDHTPASHKSTTPEPPATTQTWLVPTGAAAGGAADIGAGAVVPSLTPGGPSAWATRTLPSGRHEPPVDGESSSRFSPAWPSLPLVSTSTDCEPGRPYGSGLCPPPVVAGTTRTVSHYDPSR